MSGKFRVDTQNPVVLIMVLSPDVRMGDARIDFATLRVLDCRVTLTPLPLFASLFSGTFD